MVIIVAGAVVSLDAVTALLDARDRSRSERGVTIVWQFESEESGAAPESCASPSHRAFVELRDGAVLEPGQAYLLQADRRAWFEGRQVRVALRSSSDRHSIDRLLLSLAAGWGKQSIAVMALPLGADGEAGLSSIRAAGGLALRSSRAPAPAPAAAAERSVRTASRSARAFYVRADLLAGLRAASDCVVRANPKQRRLRVWMPSCKRGGMTYTVVMLLLEAMSRSGSPLEMIVYGTDDDEAALAVARAGRYPAGAALGMDPGLRSRYTFDESDTIRVAEKLREVCVFYPHSLLRDPAMMRMDLVVCQRILDGVAPARRALLLDSLHRSVRPGGFLFALDHVDCFPEDRFERSEGCLLRARPAPPRPPRATGLAPGAGRWLGARWEAASARAIARTRRRGSGLDALPESMGFPLLICDAALRATFVSREAQIALGLQLEEGDGERSTLGELLPKAGSQLCAAARSALAASEPREVCIRVARKSYLAHISPAQQADPPRVAITCTDLTQLQDARLRAFALRQQHSAILQISALVLRSPAPSRLYADALAALLDNIPFCAAGIVVALGRSAGELQVLASSGLGVEPLRTLHELGGADELLHAAIDRGGLVFRSAERAAGSDLAPHSTLCERAPARSGRAASIRGAGVACRISRGAERLGAIALYGRRPTLDDASECFVSSVANMLGGALLRARTRQRTGVEFEVSRWLGSTTDFDGFGEGLRRSLSSILCTDSIELWSVQGPALEDWTRLVASGVGGDAEPPAPENVARLAAADGIIASLGAAGAELLVPTTAPDMSLSVLRLRGRGLRAPDGELSDSLLRIGRAVVDFIERMRFLERHPARASIERG